MDREAKSRRLFETGRRRSDCFRGTDAPKLTLSHIDTDVNAIALATWGTCAGLVVHMRLIGALIEVDLVATPEEVPITGYRDPRGGSHCGFRPLRR